MKTNRARKNRRPCCASREDGLAYESTFSRPATCTRPEARFNLTRTLNSLFNSSNSLISRLCTILHINKNFFHCPYVCPFRVISSRICRLQSAPSAKSVVALCKWKLVTGFYIILTLSVRDTCHCGSRVPRNPRRFFATIVRYMQPAWAQVCCQCRTRPLRLRERMQQ